MNFQGQLVLVYLEEDNIARAYFRIQPLMTQDGLVGPTREDYPDDGYLRIVPDRNEQHTFKERMRGLCGLCVMDLRNLPPDANKIRTNKNYSPARGETNQYIIYSDAVRPLPDDLIYQVVPREGVSAAATAQVYIRSGANIQGPFQREDGQAVGDAVQLPPDSCEIHAVTVNGQELLFYWPRKELPAPAETPRADAAASEGSQPKEKPAPDPWQNAYEQIQALNTAPSADANRLHETESRLSMDFVPPETQKPLTGTRLYQPPQQQPAPRRAHNPLMETVERERYAARYEGPGATLPQSAALKEVANPADALKRALDGMWQCPETQKQAVDMVLARPNLRAMLSKAISLEANDLTVAAMHRQLQELEAERLMALMQLDEAKKNLSAAREEALGQLTAAEQKKLDEAEAARQKAQSALDELNQALLPIEQKREEAAARLKEMTDALENAPLTVCPPAGEEASREALILRTEKALKAAGFQVEAGDALALLTAWALSEGEFSFCADTASDARSAGDAFAAALGAPTADLRWNQTALLVLPGGNAPVFVRSEESSAHPLVTCVHDVALRDRAEALLGCDIRFPQVPVYADETALPEPLSVCPPVAKDSAVSAFAGKGELTDETKAVIASLRKAAAAAGRALPLWAVEQMCRFIGALQNDLPGGVAEAIDRAVCYYLVPHMIGYALDAREVRPLLIAMPRAMKALNV